jgi:predicted AlkP superfamily pyrophosphatase or phosphodiesterase
LWTSDPQAELVAGNTLCYKTAMPLPAMLVMVSLDGLRADALGDPALALPALRGLASRGVRARSLRPVFPSVTWPTHTSLVTGATPARHGVLGNLVFDRATGRVVQHEGDPLAQAAGQRPAVERYGRWSARHATTPMQDWLTLEAALDRTQRRSSVTSRQV